MSNPYKRPFKPPHLDTFTPINNLDDIRFNGSEEEESSHIEEINQKQYVNPDEMPQTYGDRQKRKIDYPDKSFPPIDLMRKRITTREEHGLERRLKDHFCCGKLYKPPTRLNEHYFEEHKTLPLVDPVKLEGVFIRKGKEREHEQLKQLVQFHPFPVKQPSTSTWSVYVTGRTPGTQAERQSRKKDKINSSKDDVRRLSTLLEEERRTVRYLNEELESLKVERDFYKGRC